VVFGYQIVDKLCNDPFSGGWFNLPAVLILAACTFVLVIGIRESAFSNTLLVLLKVGVVLFVIGAGVGFIDMRNWTDIPTWQRIWPEERLFEKMARELVKDETLAKELAAKALAVHKIEIAKQFGTPEQIRAVEERYARDLPATAGDVAA